jgi:hypothetical protein
MIQGKWRGIKFMIYYDDCEIWLEIINEEQIQEPKQTQKH